MSYVKALRIKTDKKYHTVLYQGKPLIKVVRESIPAFYADLKKDLEFTLGTEKVKKKNSIKKITPLVDIKKQKRAKQLARCYAEMLKDWSGAKKVPAIDENHKDFKHLLSAVDIIKGHGVNYKTFIQAQIEGLKFVEGGKGVFPKIPNLSTTNAEMRLLDYLKRNGKLKGSSVAELTDKEKETPLQDNPLYVERYDKVIQGTATYEEAQYVKNCIIARRGKVPKKYLRKIEKIKKH